MKQLMFFSKETLINTREEEQKLRSLKIKTNWIYFHELLNEILC